MPLRALHENLRILPIRVINYANQQSQITGTTYRFPKLRHQYVRMPLQMQRVNQRSRTQIDRGSRKKLKIAAGPREKSHQSRGEPRINPRAAASNTRWLAYSPRTWRHEVSGVKMPSNPPAGQMGQTTSGGKASFSRTHRSGNQRLNWDRNSSDPTPLAKVLRLRGLRPRLPSAQRTLRVRSKAPPRAIGRHHQARKYPIERHRRQF